MRNSGDLDQMPYYVASDPGLHFLPIPLQGFLVLNGLTYRSLKTVFHPIPMIYKKDK